MMGRWRDPLNTPGDWLRSSWKAGIFIAAAVSVAVTWGLFSTTGIDHLVVGTVVRIEQTGSKQLDTRAIVKLGEARQVEIALPSRTNCRTGAKIHLVQRDNVIGRSFRAALPACRD
ncbi:MAG: hypothetical protein IBJ13_03745 [Sphingopyxis sp.]|nr:hypothetical protein [Sphingopyxis sp.]